MPWVSLNKAGYFLGGGGIGIPKITIFQKEIDLKKNIILFVSMLDFGGALGPI